MILPVINTLPLAQEFSVAIGHKILQGRFPVVAQCNAESREHPKVVDPKRSQKIPLQKI